MKCPIDQTEMEKGVIAKDSVAWISKDNFAGKISTFGKKIYAKLSMGKPLWAYRCPMCGKVELTSET